MLQIHNLQQLENNVENLYRIQTDKDNYDNKGAFVINVINKRLRNFSLIARKRK